MNFPKFPKVPRYSRECVITEKIDGTNASVHSIPKALVELDGWPMDKVISGYGSGDNMIYVFAGSRKRFVTPDNDNYGFAKWVQQNADELINLNAGSHYGEWWGQGVQRKYNVDEKRFSLFNVNRWADRHELLPEVLERAVVHEKATGIPLANSSGKVYAPACCHVVPTLHKGIFGEVTYDYAETESTLELVMRHLKEYGSQASPGFMDPEGVMIYHVAANQLFKKTFEKDETGKEK